MGAGRHGGFGHTKGSGLLPLDLQFFATKAIGNDGHITENSISAHREFSLEKVLRRLKRS